MGQNISASQDGGINIGVSQTDPVVVGGWTHIINTISAANLSKVNTIAKANIAKINTI